MDMSRTDKSDKRRPSALDILNREDPLEKVQRLEKEIAELRAFRLRAKGVLAETRRSTIEDESPHGRVRWKRRGEEDRRDFSTSGDDPQRRDHSRRQIPIEPVRYSKNRERFPQSTFGCPNVPQTESIGYGRQETNADPNS